LVLNIFHLFTL